MSCVYHIYVPYFVMYRLSEQQAASVSLIGHHICSALICFLVVPCPVKQVEGGEFDPPRPLPWYPNNYAWHMSFSRGQLRKVRGSVSAKASPPHDHYHLMVLLANVWKTISVFV